VQAGAVVLYLVIVGGDAGADDHHVVTFGARSQHRRAPGIRVLVAAKPSPGDLAAWAAVGATELLWELPDEAIPAFRVLQ
jgi:hypothetical protein